MVGVHDASAQFYYSKQTVKVNEYLWYMAAPLLNVTILPVKKLYIIRWRVFFCIILCSCSQSCNSKEKE